jgi:NAD(P)H-hydrate epimerase
MRSVIASHPILSCDEARRFEAKLFAGDEVREWPAMQRAGRAIAAAVRRDFQEIGGFPADGRVLVLAGKGHNAGDAFIAAQAILETHPRATAEVVFALGERSLRPLAARAWRELAQAARDRVAVSAAPGDGAFALCLDGVFGFQFRPPADERIATLLARISALPIRLRAAVDLPSADLFRADFTYATGAVKSPALTENAGRVRYLDLGFFRGDEPGAGRVLTPAVLAPLAALRPVHTDKRAFGNVFVMGGTRGTPGAILMTVLAALRSGAGLVTAFVPETLAPAYAARAPEAMWVGWPETPDGALALEGQHLLEERLDRAAALVIGPGLGHGAETQALVRDVVRRSQVPLVLDADALQPDVVRTGSAPRILTPHAGEFARIAGGKDDMRAFAAAAGATVILKGPLTRIASAGDEAVYHSFFGGPVLARGGSGDLLAGLAGGLLAQTPDEPLLAACRATVWHGLAADALARAHGQTAVQVTQLLDFLPPVLREL